MPIKIISNFFVLTFLPQSKKIDVQRLLLLGIIATTYFLYFADFAFPGGANHFTTYANTLAFGGHLGTSIAQRDIGYPLLLWISGYPYTHSLIGIILIQALMAILIPILSYLTIQFVYPKTAFYVSIFMIVSLSPYQFVKWIHHDQMFIFFSVLSICLLCYYIKTKSYYYFYALTIAVLLTSLSRPAGNLLYPSFLFVALLFDRKNVVHYLICTAFVIAAFTVYNYHRYHVFEMAKHEHFPSYTGEQVFYNLYMNSKEYNVDISKNIGPNMDRVINNLYNYITPNPSESKYSKLIPRDVFYSKYFYSLSTNELMKNIFTIPNWEYFNLLCASSPDSDFLKASLEIIKKYPWYLLSFTARNTFLMLYSPGYAHTRYNILPLSKTGLENAYCIQGRDELGISIASVYPRAHKEISIVNTIQSNFFTHLTESIKFLFYKYYDLSNNLLFYLMLIAWIPFLLLFLPRKMANKLNYLIQKNHMGMCFGISLILLENVVIACMFAEPSYRYNNFILPLKIILGGFGIGLMLNLLKICVPMNFYAIKRNNLLQSETQLLNINYIDIALLVLLSLCFYSWAHYINLITAAL